MTFRLRSHDNGANKRYLNEGRWFYGDKNSVRTSFIQAKLLLVFGNYGLDLAVNYENKILLFYDGYLQEELPEVIKLISKKILLELDEFLYENRLLLIPENIEIFSSNFKKLLSIIDVALNHHELENNESFRTIPQEEFQENLDYILKKRKELKEKKQQEFPHNLISQGKTPTKVFLTDFSIKNYYTIKETSIQGLPEFAPWIFLTGQNGAGKSLILQALSIGLYGNKEENIIPKNSAIIKATYQSQDGTSYRNSSKQLGKFKPLPYFAGFGPMRLDVQTEGSENKSSKRSTATYGLFGNYDALSKNIETELKFAFYENRGKYLALIKMLKQVIPSLVKIEFDKRNRSIRYFEKNKDNETYKAVTFSELATGIKSIIAMVGDIYLRFSALKQKNLKTDEYVSPDELYGIVIIDELDLHLHPTWQRQLPTLFSSVFPNIQFIASTHSAIPILGAPEGSVLLKVNRDSVSGITVERLSHLEKQLANLTPNLILSSAIFGLKDIFPVTHKANEQIRTENTMEELKANDEMMDALKSYMNTDKEEELLKLFAE